MGVAEELARRAKAAQAVLAQASSAVRNDALVRMAGALRDEAGAILQANAADVARACDAGMRPSLVDRLRLDEGRVEAMAQGLLASPRGSGVSWTGRACPTACRWSV